MKNLCFWLVFVWLVSMLAGCGAVRHAVVARCDDEVSTALVESSAVVSSTQSAFNAGFERDEKGEIEAAAVFRCRSVIARRLGVPDVPVTMVNQPSNQILPGQPGVAMKVRLVPGRFIGLDDHLIICVWTAWRESYGGWQSARTSNIVMLPESGKVAMSSVGSRFLNQVRRDFEPLAVWIRKLSREHVFVFGVFLGAIGFIICLFLIQMVIGMVRAGDRVLLAVCRMIVDLFYAIGASYDWALGWLQERRQQRFVRKLERQRLNREPAPDLRQMAATLARHEQLHQLSPAAVYSLGSVREELRKIFLSKGLIRYTEQGELAPCEHNLRYAPSWQRSAVEIFLTAEQRRHPSVAAPSSPTAAPAPIVPDSGKIDDELSASWCDDDDDDENDYHREIDEVDDDDVHDEDDDVPYSRRV